MSVLSRRSFLGAAGAAVMLRRAAAAPDPFTIGLNLSSVAGEIQKDFAGTLRRVAAAGYREVELSAPLRSKRASEIRKALEGAGLRCESAHWDMWDDSAELESAIDAAVELGLKYLVTGFPALMTPAGLKPTLGTPEDIRMLTEKMTLNDWRWNIDWFNHVGGVAQKNSIQFVYRNHGMEFRQFNGVTVIDDLLLRTQPDRVKLQLDCGWAVEAGRDPVAFLKRYPDRVVTLHASGKAVADWQPVFAAAKSAGVHSCFVAQAAGFEELGRIQRDLRHAAAQI